MTKYLKHINQAITTYSSGRTDFVSVTAIPNEVHLYDDLVNEDNMSVNYNAHIWDDYIKNNYWTVIDIALRASPPQPIINGSEATYLLISGNYKLTLYDELGNVIYDFTGENLGTDPTDGNFSTATVRYVNGMYRDLEGSVYFVDKPNSDLGGGDTLIRKLVFTTPTTGSITTISSIPQQKKRVLI